MIRAKKLLLIVFFLSAIPLYAANSDESKYSEAGIKSEIELEKLFIDLKEAVKKEDVDKVASMVFLPNSFYINGKEKRIRGKEEFDEHYDKIINSNVKAALYCASINDLSASWRGVSIGMGDIWIALLKKPGDKAAKLYVRTINNEPWPKGYFRGDDPCYSEKLNEFESQRP